MSLFNSFFKNQGQHSSDVDWININSLQQLDAIAESSFHKPVLIFKHSTRCAISRMSLKQFEREFGLQREIETYFLDLLQHREISNEIAARFQVTHQSPQMLLIKDGKSIYNASHDAINAAALAKAL